MGDLLQHSLAIPERHLYGNSIAEWVAACVLGAVVWLGLLGLRRLVASRYERYTSDAHPVPVRLIAYLVGNTRQILFLSIALYAAKESLNLTPRAGRLLSDGVLVLILLQAGLWAGRALGFYLELKERELGADRSFAGSLDIIRFLARLLIWSLLILVALDNFGVNITALLAGLGVGGVAVALALQNILGDLFASLSIALDKPFIVGDTLTIDAFTGTVERIGIKTTRLRSEAGEQIILSNADILKSRVRNYGRVAELRTVTTLRVAYDTPTETLLAIPPLLERIVAEQPNARFERCHLKSFGDWALHFELSYFRQDPALYPLLDLQQAVNFRIIEEFRRLKVDFAVPAQRVITSA
jgi:small-conductance mechanosensitive channel